MNQSSGAIYRGTVNRPTARRRVSRDGDGSIIVASKPARRSLPNFSQIMITTPAWSNTHKVGPISTPKWVRFTRLSPEDDDEQLVYRKFIKPETESVTFAKALNRSVIGSINELVMVAEIHLIEGEMAPHEVGFKLNDFLLSAIAAEGDYGYGKPKEAFRRLADHTIG